MAITQGLHTDKRMYFGFVFAAIIALAAAGWYGYSWYVRTQEEAAYKDLALSIDGYMKALGTPQASEKWTDVMRAFSVGAERHPSSKMQPYFLVYKAEALLQGAPTPEKIKEAAALMSKALTLMDTKNPLYTTYALKRALLQKDSGDAALEKQGQEELEKLASDAANPSQDAALYYSGLAAEQRSDKTYADKQFKAIIDHGQEASYWYQRAQNKLQVGA